MLSKSCEYAIRATIYLYHQSRRQEERIGIDQIIKGVQSPRHFTAKLLQILSREQIISSVKGPHGGFYMTIEQGRTPLIDIVSAIDGLHLVEGCLLGLEQCNENHPCPIHEQFKPVRLLMLRILKTNRIADLSDRLEELPVFLSIVSDHSDG